MRDLQTALDRTRKEMEQKTLEFAQRETEMKAQHQYAGRSVCCKTGVPDIRRAQEAGGRSERGPHAQGVADAGRLRTGAPGDACT
jgi:hypothetical protein